MDEPLLSSEFNETFLKFGFGWRLKSFSAVWRVREEELQFFVYFSALRVTLKKKFQDDDLVSYLNKFLWVPFNLEWSKFFY